MSAIPGLHDAAGDRHGRGPGVKSNVARSLVLDLLDAPAPQRLQVMRDLEPHEWKWLLTEAQRETGSLYGLWFDTPSGFIEDVIGETVWGKQRQFLDAIVTHKRVAVPAGFGVGKCVHCCDMIPLADGRMVKAEDLVGTEFEVMAWQEDGAQVARRAWAAWNAVEPVYRVRTVSGREVTRNGEHPLWSAAAVSTIKGGKTKGTVTLTPEVRGWTATKDLAAGDLVLVPERHHAEGTERVSHEHALLLGYLLGDGGTTNGVVFTQQPGPAFDEFKRAAEAIGCTLRKEHRPYDWALVSADKTFVASVGRDGRPGAWRQNPAIDFARRAGLYGCKAKDKRLPDWGWRLPNDQLAVVMGRLFACDAWVYEGSETKGRVAVQVGIALASEGLIRDIEMAMLRLGIWGNVRHRKVRTGGKEYDAWEWVCRDREALMRLADMIDMPGKNRRLLRLLETLAGRSTARMLRWPRKNAPQGYRWDRIKEIEVLPAEQTVALTVDRDHTFVTTMVEHNTWGAGRVTAWAGAVNPPGSMVVVTTATRERQVKRQMWPHIREAVAKGKLPGHTDIMQWSMPNSAGNNVVVAYGFSAADNDEAAMQGIHGNPRLLLVVDEAGGIAELIGKGTNNLLTGDARMLAIGNPAMNDPGSWFEGLCAEGENPDEPTTITIRVAAIDSPAITGEETPICRACVPNLDGHTIAGGTPSHLPDRDWLLRTLREYGANVETDAELDEIVRTRKDPLVHPYVTAKVFAQFPKDGGNKVMPASWVDAAREVEDPVGESWIRLCDLGIGDERETFTVQAGSWVRLGVDVAADGGDEFTIYRMIGDVIHKVHSSAGQVNIDSTVVAEKILEEIDRAQRIAVRLGSKAPVRVKVDKNGLGWGAVGSLERWFDTGRHQAQIVGVMVSEKPEREDAAAVMRPYRKRDEMWMSGRFMLQPDPSTGFGRMRLRVDKECAVQLTLPNLEFNSAGFTVVESKRSLKQRGVSSPDRAEGALLAMYEPHPVMQRKRRGVLTRR